MEIIRRSRAVPILAALLAAVVALTLVWDDPAEARKKKRKKVNKIVFDSNRTTGEGVDNPTGDLEIFIMNPDGTRVKQLTFNEVKDDEPVLSPDGMKIAWQSQGVQDSNPEGEFEIYTMNVNGSDVTNLTNNGAAVLDQAPDFSPDSREIAYSSTGSQPSNPEGDVEVFKMNAADGSGQANITNTIGDVHDFRPDFSPNGNQIAYTLLGTVGSNPEGDSEIYVMDADPNTPDTAINLTNNSVAGCQFALACIYDLRPDFSPDGTQIVYDRGTKLVGNAMDDTRDVYKMNSDGTGQTNLTVTLGIDDRSPDFSPKGDKIVYMVEGGGDREVYTMNANGSGSTNLTDDASTVNSARAADELPDWGVQLKRR